MCNISVFVILYTTKLNLFRVWRTLIGKEIVRITIIKSMIVEGHVPQVTIYELLNLIMLGSKPTGVYRGYYTGGGRGGGVRGLFRSLCEFDFTPTLERVIPSIFRPLGLHRRR